MDGLTFTRWPKPPLQIAMTFTALHLALSEPSLSWMNLAAGASPGAESAKSPARLGFLRMRIAQSRLIPIATSTYLMRNHLSIDTPRSTSAGLLTPPVIAALLRCLRAGILSRHGVACEDSFRSTSL